jgi:hypothetical protein
MIEGFKDAGRLLYHYTKMKTAQEHIFPTWKIRMGSFRQMNDPKETRTWHFDLGTNEKRDLLCKERDELCERLSVRFKDHARVLCFCQDVGPLTGQHLVEIGRRGFARPRMWAQYGEAYTGVCLVFDRQKLEQRIKQACEAAFEILAAKVSYRDRGIVPDHQGHYIIGLDHLERVGFDQYWKNHARQFARRLFFEKMEDWRDEVEFRYVAFFNDRPEVLVDMADALVGVIFGDAAEEKAVDALIEILRPRKVQMMGLQWHNCSPWYDFGNLKYSPTGWNSPWAVAQDRARKAKEASSSSAGSPAQA